MLAERARSTARSPNSVDRVRAVFQFSVPVRYPELLSRVHQPTPAGSSALAVAKGLRESRARSLRHTILPANPITLHWHAYPIGNPLHSLMCVVATPSPRSPDACSLSSAPPPFTPALTEHRSRHTHGHAGGAVTTLCHQNIWPHPLDSRYLFCAYLPDWARPCGSPPQSENAYRKKPRPLRRTVTLISADELLTLVLCRRRRKGTRPQNHPLCPHAPPRSTPDQRPV